MDFVRTTTETGGAKFVPPAERIATFDQDGTLWVEHPVYSLLPGSRAGAGQREAGIEIREPFKTELSGDPEAISKLSLPDIEKIVFVTVAGMTTGQFQTEVKDGRRPPEILAGNEHIPNSPTCRCKSY